MPGKQPLAKFTNFTKALLPHETRYLLSAQRFSDPERLAVLERVDHNCRYIHKFIAYDLEIDKRKYNHLQNWITAQLDSIDVDKRYQWKLELEQKIMSDTIDASEEKVLLKAIRRYQYPTYNFSKFYELVGLYGQFLLIRIRREDYRLVENFLIEHEEAYHHSKATYRKIQRITKDIVEQYTNSTKESRQWEKWLEDIFFDEQLDGYNRFLALVRLVFIASNYRNFDLIDAPFNYLDTQYAKGNFYSKRNLLNYYSNRLLQYSSYRQYDQAAFYGRLSIRVRNHDYVFYVNNLCAVLLRQEEREEALNLMKAASTAVKSTKNFHSRIGFVAFYMLAMIKNDLVPNACSYGGAFLRAYSKQILSVRWHLFFSVYLRSVLQYGDFDKVLKITRKYKLLNHDKNYTSKPNYLPVIPWYYEIARYREGLISENELLEAQQKFKKISPVTHHDSFANAEMQRVLRQLIPEVMKKVNGSE